MKVTKCQFAILSLLTLCSILWLLMLTCFREYWGFWQSPSVYSFLNKEYPQWFRDYILNFYHATLLFATLVYFGWLGLCHLRLGSSSLAKVALVAMTLLFGMTIGVMCANNLIHFLDSGHLHGKTHLRDRY